MKTYTIMQVSELLKISKDTLRYYDSFGLIKPKRGDNRYRYYTDQDVADLQFVEIAKNGDYSLEEIKLALQNQKLRTIEGFKWQMQFMKEKRQQLRKKAQHIQAMIKLMDEFEEIMDRKLLLNEPEVGAAELKNFVEQIYWDLRRNEIE